MGKPLINAPVEIQDCASGYRYSSGRRRKAIPRIRQSANGYGVERRAMPAAERDGGAAAQKVEVDRTAYAVSDGDDVPTGIGEGPGRRERKSLIWIQELKVSFDGAVITVHEEQVDARALRSVGVGKRYDRRVRTGGGEAPRRIKREEQHRACSRSRRLIDLEVDGVRERIARRVERVDDYVAL